MNADGSSLDILIDFPAGVIRAHSGEQFDFRFDIQRELIETVVAERAVDWSNSLLLSCRFTAWRSGEFNEYVSGRDQQNHRPDGAMTTGHVCNSVQHPCN